MDKTLLDFVAAMFGDNVAKDVANHAANTPPPPPMPSSISLRGDDGTIETVDLRPHVKAR